MSNITTEKKVLEQLTDIDLSFMFNSKVSSIVDDYLFNKETAKGGLKGKREPENIVGTKKSKKEAKKTIMQIISFFTLFMDKELLLLLNDIVDER